MQRKVTIALILIPCLLVLIELGTIAKCEILTSLHGEEFRYGYLTGGMLPKEPVDYKILKYSKTQAKVYYIGANKSSGDIFRFVKIDGKWECDYWDVIWSKIGSADGMVWPYIWDSVSGQFHLIIWGILTIVLGIIIVAYVIYRKCKLRF
jgi:hypothetical protein